MKYTSVLSSSLCHHLHVCGLGGAGVEESTSREADPFLLYLSAEVSCQGADGTL